MREPITQQIAAIILESETYLNIYNTPKNIIANISSKIGFTPKTTPALVATAFPPLNLRYIGYTWPSIANKPTINPCEERAKRSICMHWKPNRKEHSNKSFKYI